MPPVLKTEVMPSLLEVELKLKSIKPADGTLNLSPFYRRKDNCSVDLQRRRPLENDTCLCIDFWTRSVKRFARSWESRWQHCTEISTKPTTINLLYNSVPPASLIRVTSLERKCGDDQTGDGFARKKEPIILLSRIILLLFFGVVGLFSIYQYPSCTNLMTVNVRSLKRWSDSSSILVKVFIYIR